MTDDWAKDCPRGSEPNRLPQQVVAIHRCSNGAVNDHHVCVIMHLLFRVSRSGTLRRYFLAALWRELGIIWPILSGLIVFQLVLGMVVGLFEGWPVRDAAYFTFVTGLTIGYGDLVPSHLAARIAALLIGFSGILLTGLIAAVGVSALQQAKDRANAD